MIPFVCQPYHRNNSSSSSSDYNSINMDSFKIGFQGIDWYSDIHSNDVNLGFEAFLQLFNTTVDKHAGIKELAKKRGR